VPLLEEHRVWDSVLVERIQWVALLGPLLVEESVVESASRKWHLPLSCRNSERNETVRHNSRSRKCQIQSANKLHQDPYRNCAACRVSMADMLAWGSELL
jgi:hypothetical protein